MTATVIPTMTVVGLPVMPMETFGASPDVLLAVDQLTIRWGRDGLLDQPTPATASFTVLDRSRGGTLFARRTDLIGNIVTLGYTSSDGPSGINFRGRITDLRARPRRLPADPTGGFLVDVAASSLEVDLANYVVPDGQSFPAETFAARRTRLLGLVPAGVAFVGGIELPSQAATGLAADPATANAAPVTDAGGSDALALLRSLYNSVSPLPMVYDPNLDKITYAARARITYSSPVTRSARLTTSTLHAGRYVASSIVGAAGFRLDAGQLANSIELDQNIETRITRVEVGYLDAAASYAQRTAPAWSANAAQEWLYGRRTLSVSSIHADASWATQLALSYAAVVDMEGRLPKVPPVGFSTARTPFPDGALAGFLLAGYERGDRVFLASSWLPQLGVRPLVGILGATITYRAGDWEVEFTPSPVVIDPAPNYWAPVTIAAAANSSAIHLSHIDPSVTLGDLASIDVGAGYTAFTSPAYKGNPTP